MIVIDYRDKRPIYEQVVERFETLILNGVLEPDEKLPSVRSLAVELSINPNTIQRAYGELERRGLIYSAKGKGNFVAACDQMGKMLKTKALEEFAEKTENCRKAGLTAEELIATVKSHYGDKEEIGS